MYPHYKAKQKIASLASPRARKIFCCIYFLLAKSRILLFYLNHCIHVITKLTGIYSMEYLVLFMIVS